MLEVVLDTNVLVAALRSKRGAAYQLIQMIGIGDWRLNISVPLALEYEDVLKRTDMVPHLANDDVDAFLDFIFRAAKLVPRVSQRRPILRDPKDECILELALEAQAIIITYNEKDFAGVERYGIVIWNPARLLKELRQANGRER